MRSAVLALAAALALSAGACTTPADRAAGGAAVGGLTGAAIGPAATGQTGAALVGAAAAPPPAVFQCPYGTIRDAAGNRYCR